MTLAQTCTYAHTHTKKKERHVLLHLCTLLWQKFMEPDHTQGSLENIAIPSILGCMSSTYRAWNHPKAAPSPAYWAVCRRPTGPETTPKPLHPQHTGLYVVDLQGLKPPQSRSIPSILGCMSPTYRAWNHPKAPQRLQCFNKKNVNMRLCLKKRHPLERPKLRGIPCFLRHLVGPLDFITPYWTQLWHPSFVGVCVYIYICINIYIYVLYGHLRGCGSHNV